jgi:hypothetical protein
MKDFLSAENARNRQHAALYTDILLAACGKIAVMIGHHLVFEANGDLSTENEIPSADCMMFDHDIMTAVFGDQAVDIMQHLAATPCQSRDDVLRTYWECVNGPAQSYPQGATPEQWAAAMRPDVVGV